MKTLTTMLWLVLFSAIAAAAQDARVITTVGEGEVAAVPDIAFASVGVTSRAAEADAALQDTSENVAAVLDQLRGAGVEAGDLRTGTVSLYPLRVPRDEAAPEGPGFEGFEAANTLEVTVRDLDRLGSLLDEIVAVGANRLNGVRFSLSDPSEAEAEARSAAVRDAMDRAAQLAEAAGVTRGPVLTIAEETRGGPMPMMEMAAARSDVPVAPGTLQVSVRVTMTFGIAD